jgi:hypothetical protein
LATSKTPEPRPIDYRVYLVSKAIVIPEAKMDVAARLEGDGAIAIKRQGDPAKVQNLRFQMTANTPESYPRRLNDERRR